MEKERLEIYRERVFGDKLNATFDFIRENWRVMLRYMTYMMLPLACVLGVTMSSLTASYMRIVAMRQGDESLPGILASYAATMLLYVLASLLLGSLVYSLMRIYRERKNRLNDLQWSELKPTFWRVFKRMLVLGLCFLGLYVLVVLAIVLLVLLTPWTLLLTIPAFLVGVLPLAYWAPAYVFEDISVFAALKKAFRLGFPTWGGILLIAIVLGMLSMVISSVVSIPWSIGMVGYVILTESNSGTAPMLMNFVLYLLTVVQSYCSLIVSSLALVGMAFQYGHAADKIDGLTVDRGIEHFEQLGDNNVDASEVGDVDNEFDDFDKL